MTNGRPIGTGRPSLKCADEEVACGSSSVHLRFNPPSERTRTVRVVTAADHLAPGPRLATDDAGAAQIDQILARRRSELARLALTTRSAVRRRDEAEAHLAEHRGGYDGDSVPTDLLAVVDSMIERAVRNCDEALASARRDADERVAEAVAESLDDLRRAGLDASHVPATRRPWPGHHVVAPPTAGELWRQVGAVRLAHSPDPVPEGAGRMVEADHGAPRPSRPSMQAPGEHGVVPASSLPSPETFEQLQPTAVATLVADEPESEEQQPGAAFDTFWQEADRDRRSRGRFLRRSAKEGS